MQRCNNQSTTYMHDMAMMHTSFFWGKDVVLLFAGWPGSGHLGMYILALAVVFVLAAAAEVFASAPTPDRRRHAQSAATVLGATAGSAASHAIHMVLAYFVMLSVMSYNVGVFLAAVAGGATGRFLVVYRSLTVAPPTEEEGY